MTNKLIQLFSTFQRLNIHFFYSKLEGGCVGLRYDNKVRNKVNKIAIDHGFCIVQEHEYKYTYKKTSWAQTIII